MKRCFVSFLALVLVLVLAMGACSAVGADNSPDKSDAAASDTAAPAVTPDQTAAAEPLRIGLIVSGSVNDNGWCATAYNALLEIEQLFGAKINFVENVGVSDIEAQLINYGEDGYDIVFCHGYEYIDGVVKTAPNFPDTWFAINGGDIGQEPNVLSINQNTFEKGYLAGIVAGLVTKTGVVGAIGGTDIPAVRDCVDGMEAGAKYVNPNVNVIKAVTGDNEDSIAALEVANSMIANHADVLIPVMGSAGLAVVTACEENGILLVGTNSDMHEFGPEVVVTSSIAGFNDSMIQIVQQYQAGSLKAISYNYGIAEDVVKLAPFYQFEDSLPKETFDKINQVVADIKSGALKTR
ncbi:MAG: BMP family protein [Bacillota bacterium]